MQESEPSWYRSGEEPREAQRAKLRRGTGGRKVEAREPQREQSEAPVVPVRVRQGAETQPTSVASGSHGVERAHVGGAGNGVIRGKLRSFSRHMDVHHCSHMSASQSRCGNHRLESRVRENCKHGSEGGDGESRFRPLSELSEFLDSGSRYYSQLARNDD